MAATRQKKFDVTAIEELKTAPRGEPIIGYTLQAKVLDNFGAPNWIRTEGAATGI